MQTQIKLTKEAVGCILCGCADSRAVYPRELPSVVRCLRCGFVYASPRLKGECVKELYSREYFESNSSEKMGYDNYVSDRELVEKTFRRRLEALEKKWLKNKGLVLDVGCAAGFFLNTAKRMGWQTHGVEISDYCCEFAKREFGLKLFNGQFKDLDGSGGSYDLVTMWDYLEHSFTPVRDVEQAFRLLNPGGFLAVATPDLGSWPARVFGPSWVGFKEHEHLAYFTKENLCGLLEKKGFKVRHAGTAGKYVSFKFFVKRLCGYFPILGRPLNFLAEHVLSGLDFYCDPCDIVTVVCQRPVS